MVKHFQTIRPLLLVNFFSVFDHFVKLALKGLTYFMPMSETYSKPSRTSKMKLFPIIVYNFYAAILLNGSTNFRPMFPFCSLLKLLESLKFFYLLQEDSEREREPLNEMCKLNLGRFVKQNLIKVLLTTVASFYLTKTCIFF